MWGRKIFPQFKTRTFSLPLWVYWPKISFHKTKFKMYLYIFLHDDLNFSFYLREKIIEINDIIYLILIYVFLNPKGEICKVRLHFKRFIANIREIIQKSFSAVTLTTNCRMKKTTKKNGKLRNLSCTIQELFRRISAEAIYSQNSKQWIVSPSLCVLARK